MPAVYTHFLGNVPILSLEAGNSIEFSLVCGDYKQIMLKRSRCNQYIACTYCLLLKFKHNENLSCSFSFYSTEQQNNYRR